MESYRDVVSSSSPIVSSACIAEMVKEAVSVSVKTEDRSKNVILYGVKEDKNIADIETEKTVYDILISIGEKLHISFSSRLGKKTVGNCDRLSKKVPIKIVRPRLVLSSIYSYIFQYFYLKLLA